jgi:coproporphyrinogen III oxidase-like Fe-S oxidoreductase
MANTKAKVSLTPPSPPGEMAFLPVYGGYQYAYPHKTAYRPLAPPVDLAPLWAEEDRGALSFYIHIPFCEMRCGFCNLFSVTGAGELIAPYLDALKRQAEAAARYLGAFAAARFAIGGGTPTALSAAQLETLFDIAASLGVDPRQTPTSVEVSPGTATPERLAALKQYGADRVSIGVESFLDDETKLLGRPQKGAQAERALGAIRDAGFPVLNIDLIYGGKGQTAQSFLCSVEAALAWEPEELYLYPLYVRPMTGLGRRGTGAASAEWDARRLSCYRAARDRLREAGYEQASMRMFRRPEVREWGPVYRCQEDGMVGLGAGARSYTRALHYSTEYAVGRAGILDILNSYLARDAAGFSRADYGARLDGAERRRRFILMSLLQTEGLSLARFAGRFGGSAFDFLPDLAELKRTGLAHEEEGFLRLTDAGIERSDAVGPWLQSQEMRARMEAFPWR